MTDSNFFSESLKPNLKLKLKKILLGQFLFRRTSGFLTSGKANEKFYKFYGVPEEKMVRFPFSWGYEEILAKAQKLKPDRENLRAFFGVLKNDFVLLYVGRLAKEKLLFTLLDAYSFVTHHNKKLFLVGDGPLRSRLEKYVKHLKIKEVYFIGFQSRENVFNFYTLADAFVLPSGDETWGIVVNEAMCFSLPIIVSDKVGAGVDLVKNGYNGFIFPAGDSKALAQSIEKLINFSPEERLLFGQRSKEIITQWVRSCDPVQQILKAIEIAKNIKS
jgi:glycosyltransferase involved in cell wall biosynthesis